MTKLEESNDLNVIISENEDDIQIKNDIIDDATEIQEEECKFIILF